MVQNLLNLMKRWGPAMEVTDYKVFVEICSFLKNRVRNENTGSTSLRQLERSKPRKSLIPFDSKLISKGRNMGSVLWRGR